jgi:hypothetical protein
VWVRVPPSVLKGVVAQAEYSYDTPMVEQGPEKTCATRFEPRLHHKDETLLTEGDNASLKGLLTSKWVATTIGRLETTQ